MLSISLPSIVRSYCLVKVISIRPIYSRQDPMQCKLPFFQNSKLGPDVSMLDFNQFTNRQLATSTGSLDLLVMPYTSYSSNLLD